MELDQSDVAIDSSLSPDEVRHLIAMEICSGCNNVDTQMFKQLIRENKLDVNHTSGYYESILQLAVRRNNVELVQFLLENGADVNQCNAFGITPLMFACEESSLEMVKMLVDGGARLDMVATENTGETALHCAFKNEDNNIFKWLIKIGADYRQKGY